MTRPAHISALVLSGCMRSTTEAPADGSARMDASRPTLVESRLVGDAPSSRDQSAPDPCDFRTEVNVRLRETRREQRPRAHLPPGVSLELLAVSTVTHPTSHLPLVLCRVRVRPTGHEGWVYLNAHAIDRCQHHLTREPDVYEQHHVRVGGTEEVWKLRIVHRITSPHHSDGPWYERVFEPSETALERWRDGVMIERVERIPVDGEGAHHVPIPRTVYAHPGLTRPTAVDVGDYNHDGEATEFVLTTSRALFFSGYPLTVIVGVTPSEPRLHVLRDARGAPLQYAQEADFWDAVRARPSGETLGWRCGAHGTTLNRWYRWRTTPRGLVQTHIETAMTDDCLQPLPARATIVPQSPLEE